MRDEYVRDEFDHEGSHIRIINDPGVENPYFDHDGMDHLLTWHRRSTFSPDRWEDYGIYRQGESYFGEDTDDGEETWLATADAIEAWLARQYGAECVPVYLYDHSGQSVSARSFVGRAPHASWDSGQIGFAFMTREEIVSEFGGDTDAIRATVRERLVGNVETLNEWLTGEVYGYEIEYPDGGKEDCWGFYGFEACRDEAIMQASSVNARAGA